MTDRRFGVNKFGQQKFGASSLENLLAWGVEVDWAERRYFDGSSEARRMTGLNIFRGRKQWLKSGGDGFESLRTGTATLDMQNDDGRYDAWNSAGELYPNVGSNKDFRMRVRDRSTDAVYNVFRGVVSDVDPGEYGNDPMATISAEDGWRFLRSTPASVAMQTSVSPDAAIGAILDDVGWPSRWGRLLEAVTDTIPYWWADGSSSAGNDLEEIANSFLHTFYVDNIGRARLLGRSTVSVAAQNYSESELSKRIANPQPQLYLRNVTKVQVHPRALASTGVIFQYSGTPLVLTAGATLNLFVDYSYNGVPCPAISVVTPVAGTDWKTNTAADGSGTDKTANATCSFSDLGQKGKYSIKNNDAGTVYVWLLQVRGQAVYEPDTGSLTYPSDLSVVVNPRQFLVDLKWNQNVNTATDLVNVLGAFLAAAHPTPTIEITDWPALQFGVDLFNIVSLTAPRLGINGVTFRVGGIEHRSNGKTCQSITTKLYLEPYITAANFWAWDVASVWDDTTVFGY